MSGSGDTRIRNLEIGVPLGGGDPPHGVRLFGVVPAVDRALIGSTYRPIGGGGDMDFQFKRGHKKPRTENRRRSLFKTPPKLREQVGESVISDKMAAPLSTCACPPLRS